MHPGLVSAELCRIKSSSRAVLEHFKRNMKAAPKLWQNNQRETQFRSSASGAALHLFIFLVVVVIVVDVVDISSST